MRIFAEIGGRETQSRASFPSTQATLRTSFGANGRRDQLIGLPSTRCATNASSCGTDRPSVAAVLVGNSAYCRPGMDIEKRSAIGRASTETVILSKASRVAQGTWSSLLAVNIEGGHNDFPVLGQVSQAF